jgi:hypothetical protein
MYRAAALVGRKRELRLEVVVLDERRSGAIDDGLNELPRTPASRGYVGIEDGVVFAVGVGAAPGLEVGDAGAGVDDVAAPVAPSLRPWLRRKTLCRCPARIGEGRKFTDGRRAAALV